MLVVFQPDGTGFVTGGGWINSSAASCTGALSICGPSAAGKANFGFVSKYQKGASKPTGETEFQFKAGNLDFHSTAYDQLVVSGPLAQYKGTGTINGQGSYRFMITGRDGRLTGGGGVDGFRMKITDATGTVIYDNLIGADEAMANVQVLGGGSVQIQNK
jgi:hypothetical protein